MICWQQAFVTTTSKSFNYRTQVGPSSCPFYEFSNFPFPSI